jgi:hypothetical protein
LGVGAHVPAGPSTFEVSVWEGSKRLHYTSLRRETREDSKDLVVGTAIRLPLNDGGIILERDRSYTISVLQRGKNTPSVQGCVSRARGGPPPSIMINTAATTSSSSTASGSGSGSGSTSLPSGTTGGSSSGSVAGSAAANHAAANWSNTGGVEWTFSNNTPNLTGLGDNGTSDTRGQLPCFWYKVLMM